MESILYAGLARTHITINAFSSSVSCLLFLLTTADDPPSAFLFFLNIHTTNNYINELASSHNR